MRPESGWIGRILNHWQRDEIRSPGQKKGSYMSESFRQHSGWFFSGTFRPEFHC
jgi:isoleucyl-tRNA synthetase